MPAADAKEVQLYGVLHRSTDPRGIANAALAELRPGGLLKIEVPLEDPADPTDSLIFFEPHTLRRFCEHLPEGEVVSVEQDGDTLRAVVRRR